MIIIKVANRMGLPTCTTRSAIVSSFSNLLGWFSLFLKILSIITIAPSTIIPKSMAPKESRLAGISVKCINIKAISKEIGIVIATKTAPRQLPKNKIKTKTTSPIPSIKVRDTVFNVVSTKSVRSKKAWILTPSGSVSSFNSRTVSFISRRTTDGFSCFNNSTIPSILSGYSLLRSV